MKVYKIPFDVKREEKIFGGYLSLRQVLYLMLSSLILLATSLPDSIKFILIMLISTFFLLCTFLKIGGQNFDKFFFYALKYLFRKKNYIYERCNKC